jgi:hypothetical protein
VHPTSSVMHCMSSLTLLTITLVPFAIGIELIRRGRRGYAIDDHPICRRCGFDLFGLPSGSTRCSECGRDLHSARAIMRGTRVRSGKLMLLGSALIVMSLAGTGVNVRRSLADTGTAPYMPVWLLLRDARNGNTEVSASAFAEIRRRIDANALEPDALHVIIETALDEQEKAATWNVAWGNLIEDLIGSRLGDYYLHRYLRGAVRAAFFVQPRVQHNVPVQYRLSYDTRLGSGGKFWVHAADGYSINGGALESGFGPRSLLSPTTHGYVSPEACDRWERLRLSIGRHDVRLRARITIARHRHGWPIVLQHDLFAESSVEVVESGE